MTTRFYCEQLDAMHVVPVFFSDETLVSIYHGTQYYKDAIGLVLWQSRQEKVDHIAERHRKDMFVEFVGPMNKMKDLPEVSTSYPYNLGFNCFPSATYFPVSWCCMASLREYLNSKLLFQQVHS